MGKASGTSGKRGRGRLKGSGKRQTSESIEGEQLSLIDVGPENLKEIMPWARRYNAAMHERLAALQKECEAKEKILALVKEAKLSRLPDGSIRFKCQGMTISVTPRDEVIQIKEDKPEKEDGKGNGMAATVAATEKED